MCLAFYKPAEAEPINKKWLYSAASSNPDGWGIITFEDGKVRTFKGLKMQEFFPVYEALERSKLPIIGHFRLATHGEKTEDNCHPFSVEGVGSFVHNGIFHIPRTNPRMSDTWHWVMKVAEQLKDYLFVDKPRLKYAVQMVSQQVPMGWNKIVAMLTNGEVVIFNESDGKWIDGSWFSNDYSLNRYDWDTTKKIVKEEDDTLPKKGSWVLKTFEDIEARLWKAEPEYDDPVTLEEVQVLTCYQITQLMEKYPSQIAELVVYGEQVTIACDGSTFPEEEEDYELIEAAYEKSIQCYSCSYCVTSEAKHYLPEDDAYLCTDCFTQFCGCA